MKSLYILFKCTQLRFAVDTSHKHRWSSSLSTLTFSSLNNSPEKPNALPLTFFGLYFASLRSYSFLSVFCTNRRPFDWSEQPSSSEGCCPIRFHRSSLPWPSARLSRKPGIRRHLTGIPHHKSPVKLGERTLISVGTQATSCRWIPVISKLKVQYTTHVGDTGILRNTVDSLPRQGIHILRRAAMNSSLADQATFSRF